MSKQTMRRIVAVFVIILFIIKITYALTKTVSENHFEASKPLDEKTRRYLSKKYGLDESLSEKQKNDYRKYFYTYHYGISYKSNSENGQVIKQHDDLTKYGATYKSDGINNYYFIDVNGMEITPK